MDLQREIEQLVEGNLDGGEFTTEQLDYMIGVYFGETPEAGVMMANFIGDCVTASQMKNEGASEITQITDAARVILEASGALATRCAQLCLERQKNPQPSGRAFTSW